MTPSCRFPLLAGGTEPLRGSPREAGGTEEEQSGTLAARLVQQKGGKAQLASLPLMVRRSVSY